MTGSVEGEGTAANVETRRSAQFEFPWPRPQRKEDRSKTCWVGGQDTPKHSEDLALSQVGGHTGLPSAQSGRVCKLVAYHEAVSDRRRMAGLGVGLLGQLRDGHWGRRGGQTVGSNSRYASYQRIILNGHVQL